MKNGRRRVDQAVCRGSELQGFNVYPTGSNVMAVPDYNRRDYYKICVVKGDFLIGYDQQTSVCSGHLLFLGSPLIPYCCEALSAVYEGFACVFTDAFLKKGNCYLNPGLLFDRGCLPMAALQKNENDFITGIFQKMISVYESDYKLKDQMIRSYIQVILITAQRILTD